MLCTGVRGRSSGLAMHPPGSCAPRPPAHTPSEGGGPRQQQLSARAATCVHMENPHAPMHMGGIQIYDPSTVHGGKQRFKDILGFVEERLHLARTFRQKLVPVPFNLDHPWWIEDKDFDLEYHIRHIRLPEPG